MKQEKEPKKKKEDLSFQVTKKGRRMCGMLNFLRIIVIPLFFLIYPFRYYGNRKVKDGACIYIGNHYRIWDIIYPAATTWEGIHFLSKKSVTSNWFMEFWCRGCKVISVNRDGNDARAIMESIRCLKNGEKISIFPEGTRNKTDVQMLPFKPGASMFAIRTKTPIVPIMQYKKSRPFRVSHILIGEPFELSEYYDRKLTQEDYAEADQKLYDLLLKMRSDHEAFLASKRRRR